MNLQFSYMYMHIKFGCAGEIVIFKQIQFQSSE